MRKLIATFILWLFFIWSVFWLNITNRINDAWNSFNVTYTTQKGYISFKFENKLTNKSNYANWFQLFKIWNKSSYWTIFNKDISNLSTPYKFISYVEWNSNMVNVTSEYINTWENNFFICWLQKLATLWADETHIFSCSNLISIYFDNNKEETSKEKYEEWIEKMKSDQITFQKWYIKTFTDIFNYRKPKSPWYWYIKDITGVNEFIEKQYLSWIDYKNISLNLYRYDLNDRVNGLEEFTTYVSSYIAEYQRQKDQQKQLEQEKFLKQQAEIKANQVIMTKPEYEEYAKLKQDKQFEDSMKEKNKILIEAIESRTKSLSWNSLLKYIDNAISQVNALKQQYHDKIDIIDRLNIALKLRKLEVYESI